MSKHRLTELAQSATRLTAEHLVPATLVVMLCAVAYGVYSDAKTKANVGIVKNRFSQIAAGLSAYYVDNAAYPQCNTRGTAVAYGAILTPTITTQDATRIVLERITTPIAYVNSASFSDPFESQFRYTGSNATVMAASSPIASSPTTDVSSALRLFQYQAWGPTGRAQVADDGFTPTPRPVGRQWLIQSVGPDNAYFNLGGVLANDELVNGPALLIYDPTNGAVSFGSIFRIGGIVDPYVPTYAAGEGLRAAIGLDPNGPAEPGDVSGVKGFDRYE